MLAGNDEQLLDVIPILLGCKDKNNAEGNFIESKVVPELRNLLKETEFSHLMEVGTTYSEGNCLQLARVVQKLANNPKRSLLETIPNKLILIFKIFF